jgi:hypothetical protein
VETGDLALLRGLLVGSDMLTVISAHQLQHEIATGQLTTLPFAMRGMERRIGLMQRKGRICRPAPGPCRKPSKRSPQHWLNRARLQQAGPKRYERLPDKKSITISKWQRSGSRKQYSPALPVLHFVPSRGTLVLPGQVTPPRADKPADPDNSTPLRRLNEYSTTLDVRSHINGRKMSGYQWLLLILCFLIVATDGMDVAIMGFLAPAITKEWGISRRLRRGDERRADRPGHRRAAGRSAVGPLRPQETADDGGGLVRHLQPACAFAMTWSPLGAALPDRPWPGRGHAQCHHPAVRVRARAFAQHAAGDHVHRLQPRLGAGGLLAAALLPDYGWRAVLIVAARFR